MSPEKEKIITSFQPHQTDQIIHDLKFSIIVNLLQPFSNMRGTQKTVWRAGQCSAAVA